jgi:hypothetical protein
MLGFIVWGALRPGVGELINKLLVEHHHYLMLAAASWIPLDSLATG